MPTTQAAAPQRFMQGIAIPATSVNPGEFFARTRRHTIREHRASYNHGDTQMQFELRKSDILSGLHVRFSGTLQVDPGAGTVATTRRWPYDLPKLVRYTANGAANIISASGAKLKLRDIMKKGDLTDRGVVQAIDGKDVAHGTLSQASESWGVGSGAANIPAGTYDVELSWYVPVAEDDVDLTGASFLATSSSSLTLDIGFANPADLFVTTGDATVDLNGFVDVVSTKYSIPIGADGQIVVPDLSVFHSLIETRATGQQNGQNEVILIGQGAGKSLLRVYGQLWNAPAAGKAPVPVPVVDANYGPMAWVYGGAEMPEQYPSATGFRQAIERRYNADIAGPNGAWCFDFADENVFRDVVDLGTVNDMRLRFSLENALELNQPAFEYVTETIYLAGQASA
ncbi:MAG: hypothetical protein FWF90_17345 [Promicromonosporaceae bacterium]|nr:hypothetical protein [Promicromonosporaceae bacterium]